MRRDLKSNMISRENHIITLKKNRSEISNVLVLSNMPFIQLKRRRKKTSHCKIRLLTLRYSLQKI